MARCTMSWTAFAASALAASVLCADDRADPAASAAAELNEQEQAFADLMENCVLAGGFNIDGNEDKPVNTDRYNIQSATKVKDDSWIINAHMTFGQNEIIIPVPVKMNWAGDTPVLSVTDLAIPGLGEKFSARILFYDGRYAGTWAHGEVGGLMWGKTEKLMPDEAGPAQR